MSPADARRAMQDALGPGSLVVVVSGPGGVGKGTIVERLVAADPRLHLNRSWTTRARRPGEAEDAYVFASREEFLEHARSGGFIEWVEFLDYMQGSPVPRVPPGDDVLFEVDVEGGAALAELVSDPLLVFIDAPSREVQAERMRRRGDPEEKVGRRLAHAQQEVDAASGLPYVTVVNDDLDRAVGEVAGLIARAREARAAGVDAPGGTAPESGGG